MAVWVLCPAQLQEAFGFGSQAPRHGTIPLIVLGFFSSLFYFVETDGILLLFKDVQKLCI